MKKTSRTFFSLIILILIAVLFSGCQNEQEDLKLKLNSLEKEMVRKSAVSGTFYSTNKTELSNQLDDFLAGAEKNVDHPQLIIVPHAGYLYSGSTAAAGFKQLQDEEISRIVLIGLSHKQFFDGYAIDGNDFWETPLGKVQIDKEFANKLVNKKLGFKFSSKAHAEEHSLEVQLPFLQKVIEEFKLVPILFGETKEKDYSEIADLINKLAYERTVIVISSDLSHYPDYKTAKKVDKKTIDAILTGKQEIFKDTIKRLERENKNVDTCACSKEPIKLGMQIVKETEGVWNLIKYTNSGDVTNEKNKVVGYAAITFSPKEFGIKTKKKAEEILDSKSKKTLLQIARQTIEKYLKDKKIPEYKINNPQLEIKRGVFVTLKRGEQLRGCIGEFNPEKELWRLVQKKAIDAALHDPRFDPVRLEELNDLNLEISVLSLPKKVQNWQEVEVGKHGVLIKKGLRGGTFLPQVAVDEGWDKETFLSNLCAHKAGLPPECYKDPEVEIFTYTAEVFKEE